MGVVIKYGGTSVATIEKIDAIAKHIASLKDREENIVVVVSAMGKSTDNLIQLAKKVSPNLPKREMDTLLSTGEQQTIALLSIALSKYNVDAISLTGFQAGFITTESHTKGIIQDINISRISNHLEEKKVVVVAGFQGINLKGDITTLGRGGSDTSAVAIAAKLGYRCEIYTDVDGIYTVDPRIHKEAKKINYISYTEMMEMAILGANVIEARSVELAKKYNVKLYIAKSLSANESGTYIMNRNDLFESEPITGIGITENVVVITLEGENNDPYLVSKIFHIISEENINIDMINQGIDKNKKLILSFSIDQEDMETMKECIEYHNELFKTLHIEYKTDIVKLSLIGVGMASHFGVASKVFSTLSRKDIPFYHVSTSEISISCTLSKNHMENAVKALSTAFNL